MKITKRQLRKIIKEVHPDYEGLPQSDIDYYELADDYAMWVKENGHITPAASSVMATYFLEMGLEDDHEKHEMLGKAFKVAHNDIMSDIRRQKTEERARISERSSPEYTMPQKTKVIPSETSGRWRPELEAILDAAAAAHGNVPYAELKNFFWALNSTYATQRKIMEGKSVRITKRQLRRIIKEAMPKGGVPDVVGAVSGVSGEERRQLMDALEKKYGLAVKTTEEFGSSPGGIWLSGEDGTTASDGVPLFDSYAGGMDPYDDFGVHTEFNDFVESYGFFAEWYDPGTLMLWRM